MGGEVRADRILDYARAVNGRGATGPLGMVKLYTEHSLTVVSAMPSFRLVSTPFIQVGLNTLRSGSTQCSLTVC